MTERGGEIVGAMHFMKKKGTLKIVVLGFVVGIALLLVGSFAFGEKESAESESANSTDLYATFAEYKETLRREIEEACLRVKGVQSVHAVLYFDGLSESIYAQNIQSGNTKKEEYVIIGSGSNSHALYLGESLPSLVGIGVICETGNSDGVKNEVAALLSSAYGLPLTRVYVSEGE